MTPRCGGTGSACVDAVRAFALRSASMSYRATVPLVCSLSLIVVAAACGVFAPAKSPEAELFDCRVKALAPAYPDAVAAARTAKAVADGSVSLGTALADAKAPLATALATAKAFRACSHGLPVDATPDAG